MAKSRDAFRTISEVADWLDTPAHVLRFWESKFTQIKPVKRAGGRRYYRPGDIDLLAGIKKLLHDDGMTIKGVQKILREQGVRHVSGLSDSVVQQGDAADNLIEDAPYIDVTDEEPVDTVVAFTREAEAPAEPEQENLFAEPQEPEPEPEQSHAVGAEIQTEILGADLVDDLVAADDTPSDAPAQDAAAVEDAAEATGSFASDEQPAPQDNIAAPEPADDLQIETADSDLAKDPPLSAEEVVAEDPEPAAEAFSPAPEDAMPPLVEDGPAIESPADISFDETPTEGELLSNPEDAEPIPVAPEPIEEESAISAEEALDAPIPTEFTAQSDEIEAQTPSDEADLDVASDEEVAKPIGALPDAAELAAPAESLPEPVPAEAVEEQADAPLEQPAEPDTAAPVESFEPSTMAGQETPEPVEASVEQTADETLAEPISEASPSAPDPVPEPPQVTPDPEPEAAVSDSAEALADDQDARAPYAVDPIDPSEAEVATRPLVLPDFQASDAPVDEDKAPPAAKTGPLGLLANISDLTPDQASALSAQMASLRAVQQRLSQPLQ